MSFQEKIDKLLAENNIKNLKQLAQEIDIPYTTLWDYYSDQKRWEKAGLTNVQKIAKRLNCSLDYLAYDDITDPNFGKSKNIKEHDSPILNKYAMLFDKMGELSEEDQRMVLNVTESIINEIDNKLDIKDD